ncbi:hypothetical protein EH227_22335 [Rouxiella chamberiensis]|nr:hypothetical protein EH227_22335 [Rouxiella chamberiensis]
MASHQGQTGPHECTTLLTLLPVLLSQPGAGFFFPSYFALWMRWLRALTRITYLCMLIGIHFLAAFPQHELFRKNCFPISRCGCVGCVRSPESHTYVCSSDSLSCRLPTTRTISKKNTSFLFSKSFSCLLQILWI